MNNFWGPKMNEVFTFFDQMQISYDALSPLEFIQMADGVIERVIDVDDPAIEPETWAIGWLETYQNTVRH